MLKLKSKQKIIKILSFMMLSAVLIAPMLSTVSFADEAEDKSKVVNGLNDYYAADEGEDEFVGILEKFEKEDLKAVEANKNTIQYLLSRVLVPGYINNASAGYLQDGLIDPRDEAGNMCNANAPNNLLNHNCNIPNFSASLAQSIVSFFDSGIFGAQKTTAKAPLGLGNGGIPGGVVPVNPNDRVEKYTALELYGYNLNYTSYYGEWDNVRPSWGATMLSNFGNMDRLLMTGNAIWNGAKAGLGALVDGFSFNPVKWIGGAGRAATAGTFNSIIDTSELNVVATNAWTRKSFDKTLYNVYVLTDKQIVEESSLRFLRYFASEFNSRVNASPELQEAVALQNVPEFKYNPYRQTEASEKAIAEARQAQREAWLLEQETGEEQPKVEIPKPVYMTEKEQFEEWKENNKDFLNRGKAQGLYLETAETYKELTEYWTDEWSVYSAQVFSASGIVIEELQEGIQDDFYKNDPFSDPRQPISRYVCSDSAGNPIRESNGNYKYLYKGYNTGSTENINQDCAVARPPIDNALFGTGDGAASTDTRHISFFRDTSVLDSLGNIFIQMNNMVTSFFTQAINVMLDLSFEPMFKQLGIDEMIKITVTTFRDTIFFPLAALMVALGTILAFSKAIAGGTISSILMSLITIIAVFFFGSMVLLKPDALVSTIEEVPLKVDSFILNVITNTGGDELCYAGTGESAGLRSSKCAVWKITTFDPWVYGQFGTEYKNLYSAGNAPSGGSSFQNTNQALVGDASVNMGGGTTVKNWALYQLSIMKTGTITTDDNSNKVKASNLYRLVDLQAGPNNGAQSDSRYFEAWSGQNGRFAASASQIIKTIAVGIVLASIAFIKVETTFMFALMLLISPIILLAGLTPSGARTIKGYLSTLGNFMLKRFMSVIYLGLILRILSSLSSTLFLPYMAILWALYMYRKDLMGLFQLNGDQSLSGLMGANGARDFYNRTVPADIRNKVAMTSAKIKGRTAGSLGGAASSLAQLSIDDFSSKEKFKEATLRHRDNVRRGAEAGGGAVMNLERNRIRRQGMGVAGIYKDSKDKVLKSQADEILKGNGDEAIKRDVLYDTVTRSGLRKVSMYGSSKDEAYMTALISNPSIQREVNKAAKARKKDYEMDTPNLLGEDITINLEDKIEDVEKAYVLNAKVRRKLEVITDPVGAVLGEETNLSREVKELDRITGETNGIDPFTRTGNMQYMNADEKEQVNQVALTERTKRNKIAAERAAAKLAEAERKKKEEEAAGVTSSNSDKQNSDNLPKKEDNSNDKT